MQINAANIKPGTLVLTESISSITIGRTIVATVLSMPKGGMVAVSMFGKRFMVETSMDLQKGQVLNLKVHAVTPKIVLKPMKTENSGPASSLKDVASMLSSIVGKDTEKPLETFLIQEIANKLFSKSGQDESSVSFVNILIDQISQNPQAIAFLLIPLVDGDTSSAAKVAVERQDDVYTLNFEIETEHLGSLECKAVLDKDKSIDLEIRTPSEETAVFLRSGINDLKERFEPLNVRSLSVRRTNIRRTIHKEVDVLI